MDKVRCRNKQCENVIAYVNGTVPSVTCDKCGRVRRLHHKKPTQAIRLQMRLPESEISGRMLVENLAV